MKDESEIQEKKTFAHSFMKYQNKAEKPDE
jgi:hypothetical protein